MKRFLKKYLSKLIYWASRSERDPLAEKQPTDLDLGILKVDIEVLEQQEDLLAGTNTKKLLPPQSKFRDSKKSAEQIGSSDDENEAKKDIFDNTDTLSWDQASSELRESGRPGKVVTYGSGYQVKYHDEWRENDKRKRIEKKLRLEKLLQEEEAARAEAQEKKKLRLELIAQKKAEAEAKEAERRRILDEKRKRRLAELEKERLQKLEHQQEKERESVIRAEQQRKIFEEQTRERLLRSVAEKVGKNKRIIAQYRHPGSAIERMSELGIWILEENGNFFRFHESKGRFQYAGKSREEAMKSKTEAIEYCKWLVRKGWYRDVRLHGISESNAGFPITELPTSAEKIRARKEFITWRERMAQVTQEFAESSPDISGTEDKIEDFPF
tara:strand:- start:2917 stop:4068 length:1152 start_codon:yes stop_codon:yes gene_type:complete